MAVTFVHKILAGAAPMDRPVEPLPEPAKA
jgi:hypothetical protein